MYSPALFFLIGIVFLLVILTMFVLLRLVTGARRMSQAERGAGTAYMAAAMQEAVTRMRDHERRLAARAEASERLSDQVIDSLPSGLLVTDASGRPQRINPAGARMLGVEGTDGEDARAQPSPVPATTLAALWDTLGESGIAMRSLIDECLTSGAGSSRRTLVIQRDERSGAQGSPRATEPGGVQGSPPLAEATRRHLGAGVSPLRDPDGTVTGAICLFTDLTSVVDLEDQLRLKDSLARLGELTAGLAHEFRNGLATIHGYARLMNPDRLPDDHRAFVQSLRAETESLTEIVSNFLTFAKPAQQAQVRFALEPILIRAVADARAEAAEHDGDITAAGVFGEIEGDDVLMRQAFSNLLRNAVEACVEAGKSPRVRVTGSVDRAAGLQRLTIADNGPGVPATIGDKVFQPFFTTRGRGTGLGLALVQKIIVSHNGRITLGSSPGGGAEFTIVLPLAPRRN